MRTKFVTKSLLFTLGTQAFAPGVFAYVMNENPLNRAETSPWSARQVPHDQPDPFDGLQGLIKIMGSTGTPTSTTAGSTAFNTQLSAPSLIDYSLPTSESEILDVDNLMAALKPRSTQG